MSYRPCFADAPLAEFLDSMGGVLVSGPRGCGKSTTAMRQARSQVRLDSSPNMVELADPQSSCTIRGSDAAARGRVATRTDFVECGAS